VSTAFIASELILIWKMPGVVADGGRTRTTVYSTLLSYFSYEAYLRWEIQQPITQADLGQRSVVFLQWNKTFVLSVQCRAVLSHFTVRQESKWFEEGCKVNLATLVTAVEYHVTRLEPRSRRIQPTHPTLPTLLHSVLLTVLRLRLASEETDNCTTFFCHSKTLN
jgi:hypothetical protein